MLALATEVWREHRWAFIYPDLHHPPDADINNIDIWGAAGGGTTTIIKDGRLFIRYRYYSIFALFHFDCAVSTALMATTSVSCRMDLGQIPTTANTTQSTVAITTDEH